MNSTEQCIGVHKSILDVISTVDICEPLLQVSLFFVAFNPLFWNIVSRLEYYTRVFTKLSGSPKNGCYVFAFTIFTLGMVRSYFFELALRRQVTSIMLDIKLLRFLGVILTALGQVLVLSSMYKLGVTGTYNGDYFGILMKDRVYDFPFNVCTNPMYRGSTLSFLGVALIQGKAAGLLVSLFVHFMYEVVIKFEEPYTKKIYATPKKD